MAKLGEYADKLETMTAQEVVEVGLTHLLEQGVKSTRAGWPSKAKVKGCAYKGPRGLCCGAAPFLKWDEDCEGTLWDLLVDAHKAPKTHASVIIRLQTLHDRVPVSDWLTQAKVIFSDYNLDFLSKFE